MNGAKRDWKRELKDIIDLHNDRHAVKKKSVSYKTMHGRANFLFAFFRELRKNGVRDCKISPSNLGGRHVDFMMARWIERGLAPGTIQDYLSYLRVFAGWIGKDGLVLTPTAYVRDPAQVKRTYGATIDKSWSAHGVDSAELIARITDVDAFVGAQLSMCLEFGFRVKEAIMFRPFADVTADGSQVNLVRGTKGGRRREVPIDSDIKRSTIDAARRLVPNADAPLARPDRTLEQNRNRFYTVIRKFGITRKKLSVTAHGLRHQYGNDRYEDLAGRPSPVRGGGYIGRELDRGARLGVAHELGHARENITSCYFGPIVRKPALESSTENASQTTRGS